MRYGQASGRDRAISLAGVAVIHAVLGIILVRGLAPGAFPAASDVVEIFDVLPQAPPEPPEPPPISPKVEERRAAPRPKDPEGAASPANLRDTPTPVVAPEPIIPLPVPPLLTVAPVAAEGTRASAGAADVPGPGTGAGGIGTGRGSGLGGDGTGGGGGGGTGLARPAELVGGRIRDSDWPRGVDEPGSVRTVLLRFEISPQARMLSCTVVETSGSRQLDRGTCDAARRRFRFRPARDREGRPTVGRVFYEHEWTQSAEPPPIDVEPTIPDDG